MKSRITKLAFFALVIIAAVFFILLNASTRKTNAEFILLEIELPKAVFVGTEKDIKVSNLRKLDLNDQPPFPVPAGTINVALGKPVTSTDETPIVGELSYITDGDKEAADGSFVELGPLRQHITIDLEVMYEIYAIAIWHYHLEPRVYYDVIVQVADDSDFAHNVRTLFNNDIDHSANLGVGTDTHYIETYKGELIDAKGAKARYVRLHSSGNTTDDLNHYIEVEVYGRPIK